LLTQSGVATQLEELEPKILRLGTAFSDIEEWKEECVESVGLAGGVAYNKQPPDMNTQL